MSLPDESLAAAAAALEEATEVALVCHVNPDVDAMGSMLGLAGFLAERGKEVAASWPNDPREEPRWLRALPLREHLVAPGDMPKRPDALVTLDAAAANRLGGLGHLLEKAGTTICIDHHRTNPGFGSINLIDPEASSTGEVVVRLIEWMGGTPSADVATCLYAALVTDTGRFMYEAATPETLRVAASLREHPFDHARLAQALYEDNSFAYLKALGLALERARLEPEARLAWTYLTRDDLEAVGVPIQETDDLIDVVRTAREADVAAVLKEQREGGFKISLRSRGDTDVSAVAERFGGGGHRLAAGYSFAGTLEEAVAALLDALAPARA
jgi:bifunctional oligoribonuclease and PAP phosphatase NrnA